MDLTPELKVELSRLLNYIIEQSHTPNTCPKAEQAFRRIRGTAATMLTLFSSKRLVHGGKEMNIFPLSDPSNGKTIREREEIVTNVMETMRDISIVNILKACRPLGITPIFTETTFSYNMLERMTDIDKTPLFTASLYHEVEELAKKGYATQVELVPIHNRTTREYEKMLILPFMANLLNGTPVVHMTYEEVGPLLDVLSQFNHDILQQFSQELYDAARPGYIVGTVEQEDTTND